MTRFWSTLIYPDHFWFFYQGCQNEIPFGVHDSEFLGFRISYYLFWESEGQMHNEYWGPPSFWLWILSNIDEFRNSLSFSFCFDLFLFMVLCNLLQCVASVFGGLSAFCRQMHFSTRPLFSFLSITSLTSWLWECSPYTGQHSPGGRRAIIKPTDPLQQAG